MANNFDEAKAELSDILDNKLSPISDRVGALFNDNKLDGFPYGKQAAGFNDLRELIGKVQWLVDNETFKDDQGNTLYPFSKSAASFNDLREVGEKVDALAEQVKTLTNLVTQSLST